ncbi:hypothetical protein [Nitrospirillum viridazoti]|uniref:Uncharacterized protein n=1 Tax=Nitrospirillum amazonense TaxID=28077 RepID=A0A560I1B5_9PROT|nr:hypothetical protein [Nitrospirillum amazonense]TWB52717.1 hypothetical protein FBZ92_11883 [Nitrospirillum amazonense]
MNHRQILDAALRSQPAPRSRYLNLVADRVERDGRFADRTHLLYPVLARAAGTVEPMLEPVEFVDLLAEFLAHHGAAIGAALYDRAYLKDPDRALAGPASLLSGWISARILDGLQSGRYRPPDDRTYRFHSDSGDMDGALRGFPFHEEDAAAD